MSLCLFVSVSLCLCVAGHTYARIYNAIVAQIQKQEEMEAKLKARQAERLQAERMATMRATQKEREVRAVDAAVV